MISTGGNGGCCRGGKGLRDVLFSLASKECLSTRPTIDTRTTFGATPLLEVTTQTYWLRKFGCVFLSLAADRYVEWFARFKSTIGFNLKYRAARKSLGTCPYRRTRFPYSNDKIHTTDRTTSKIRKTMRKKTQSSCSHSTMWRPLYSIPLSHQFPLAGLPLKPSVFTIQQQNLNIYLRQPHNCANLQVFAVQACVKAAAAVCERCKWHFISASCSCSTTVKKVMLLPKQPSMHKSYWPKGVTVDYK